MTPEQALAREAIRYTQAAYHLAGDRGRAAELVTNFTEDGVLELSAGRYDGRDAICARLSLVADSSQGSAAAVPATSDGESAPRSRVFLHHHLTTSHIEFVSDTEAKGWSYFLVMSPVGVDHCGRYVDTYRQVGERWLLSSRRAVVEYGHPDSIVGAKAT